MQDMTEAERNELAQLEKEIAAANASEAQANAAREPTPLEAKRAELAAAKRRAADAALIADLEKKHGPCAGPNGVKLGDKLACASTNDGMIVVKKPNREAFKQFADSAARNNGIVPFDQQEQFIKRCLVYPSVAEATPILHENPAVTSAIANLAAALGGFQQENLQGK